MSRWGKAVAVCGAVALVGAVAVIVVRRTDGQDPAATGTPSSSPSASPTPTPAPTSVSPSSPATTVPVTDRYDRDVTLNPLYRSGRVAASRCKEPAVRPTSVANVRAYYTQSVACLNKIWGPAIRKAGYPFTPPKLVVHAGRQPTNVCRVSDKAAYCANVIYMDANADIADYRSYDRLWVRTRMSFLIGHEYGHHVQDLVGIMRSSYRRASYIAETAGDLAESRRRELQASCLSGVYLGGNRSFFPAKGAWLTKWRWLVRNRGDRWNPTRSHGSPTNHEYWSLRGFNTANPAACNTFTSPPARIA